MIYFSYCQNNTAVMAFIAFYQNYNFHSMVHGVTHDILSISVLQLFLGVKKGTSALGLIKHAI